MILEYMSFDSVIHQDVSYCLLRTSDETLSLKPCIHDPLTASSSEETYLQDYLENLEKCFFGTTSRAIFETN